jgi:hypothetical protein
VPGKTVAYTERVDEYESDSAGEVLVDEIEEDDRRDLLNSGCLEKR